jgi:hypothetical protein
METGLYYEREINAIDLGVNPGLIVGLIDNQNHRYNPSIYGGYIFNKSDKIQISIKVNAMYYYAYARQVSWIGTENDRREDILFLGPDISARWHLYDFFFQASTGFRLSYEMWYGSRASDTIKYSYTYYSFSLSIGYSF